MNRSEVAQLRVRIEQECQAMHLAMNGYAVVSNHDAINHKYDAIGEYQNQLEGMVGTEQAAQIIVKTYQKIMG